ncbi:MAG: LacI family DNA-binding transcriptional regulator, partial [Spirochaetes bacterium]|nr:LacI family DNA-binding transcriptional regulator [Spirochaetota bacterium]
IPDANAFDHDAFPDHYRANFRLLRGIIAAATEARCVLNLTLVRPSMQEADLGALLCGGGPMPVLLVTADRQYAPLIELCRRRNLPLVVYSGAQAGEGHGVDLSAAGPYRSLLAWFFASGGKDAVFLDVFHATDQDEWKRAAFAETLGALGRAQRVLSLPDPRALAERLEACWKERPFDALVCGNDRLALEAGRTLRELGRRIPEEIRLLGYDRIPESEGFSPPFSSLDIPFEEIGAALVAQAQWLLLDPSRGARRATIPARPIIF